MSFAAPLPLTDRIAQALDGLCRAVAARIAGGAMAAWMITLVWTRVRRAERRLQGLLARFRAGRLWFRQEMPGRVSRGGGRAAGAQRLPVGFAWLLPLVPCEAANFASQVRVTLEDPEMVALLAACPQAVRVLAPLCRMLGIETAASRAQQARMAERQAARAERVVPPRTGMPAAPQPWRVPLPRGVLSAARRAGFGKIPRSGGM